MQAGASLVSPDSRLSAEECLPFPCQSPFLWPSPQGSPSRQNMMRGSPAMRPAEATWSSEESAPSKAASKKSLPSTKQHPLFRKKLKRGDHLWRVKHCLYSSSSGPETIFLKLVYKKHMMSVCTHTTEECSRIPDLWGLLAHLKESSVF